MTTESRVAALLAEWSEMRQRGLVVDPVDVIREHPDLERELRAAFAALEVLDLALAKGPRDVAPPERIGPYRIVRELGAGGMGTVYLAESPEGGTVALKVVHPRLAESPGYVRRLLREGALGMRVRHENVVRTLDVGTAGEGAVRTQYLVMEYVEGRTLRQIAAEMGPLPERLCRHVGGAVARALAAIHAEGAVHRDLKPDNVIVTPDEQVKLMDLGVAQVADETIRLSRTGAFVGSVLYAAPEQIAGGEADARTDLYSLGLTLYELATGIHPHQGDDVLTVLGNQARGVARRAADVVPQLSPFFDELVHTLLEKDPARRLASADETARALEEGEASEWWRERSRRLRQRDHGPLRRVRVPRETALHGRAPELARLREVFGRVLAGEGRVVLLEGEAGIGKSRLVDEFVAEVQRGGTAVHTLYGSYPPGDAGAGAGAFVSAYRDQIGESGVESYLADLPRLVPAFRTLLRGEPPPPDAQPFTGESLQTAFVQATRALAAERPTVVFIDDLHFAPDDGRALFRSLALALADARVLLIGAHRAGLPPAFLESVERLPHAERMHLGRLSPKDLVELLRSAFRSEHLAQELGAKIAEKSDGNPFFVFEIVRGLKEGQFLRQRPDGTWVTDEIIRSIEVPSSVTDVVMTRLADLAPEERDLLEAAACLGFEFDPVLAAGVIGVGPIPALQAFGRIERRHRIVRSIGRLYAFDHHQIQEVLHAGLHEQLRERYHAAIAERLELDAAGRGTTPVTGEAAVQLARHSLAGARGEAARRYVRPALDHLEALHRNQECADLAASALAAPGVLEDDVRRSVLVTRAERLSILGHRDLERAALDEAAAVAGGNPALQVRIRCLRARLCCETGDPAGAARELTVAEAIAERSGSAVDGLAVASSSAVNALTEGRFRDAERHAARHVEFARIVGREADVARGYLNLGLAQWRLGLAGPSEENTVRAMETAARSGDRRAEAAAAGNLGLQMADNGRRDEARILHERHLRLAREIGDRRGEAHATGNLGGIDGREGRSAAALDRLERDLSLCRAMLDWSGAAVALVLLAGVRSHLGLLERALRDGEEAAALATDLGLHALAAWAQLTLAGAEWMAGDRAKARARSERALATLRKQERPSDVAGALISLGAVCDEEARARACFREARELAQCSNAHPVVALSALRLALLASAAPAGSDVRADEDPAAAVRAYLEVEPLLEHASLRWGRHAAWRLTGDRAHLEAARDLLVEFRERAPPETRDVLLTVPHHREIVRDAIAAGIAPADWA